jgi:hypothetical protein
MSRDITVARPSAMPPCRSEPWQFTIRRREGATHTTRN